jgi:diguanylate cyclase (GGDEF)-like protein/PAS domain S-box-containing protein
MNMETDQNNDSQAIETLPNAYARHRIVTDESDNPVDYIFLQVNSAFEKMTELKRGNILGRRVTEVLPGIEKSEFDWIGIYGKVAQGGGSLNFEQYSELLKRWYDVQVYSDEAGFFTTVFNETTARKDELASMRNLLQLTNKLFSSDQTTFDYQAAIDSLLKLSGAKFAAINTYEEDRTKTVTRAIAGVSVLIFVASQTLGFEITGRAWDIRPERLRTIEGGKLVRFKNLFETSMGAINETTATMLQELFRIGDIYVLELAYGGRETMGDIIFFMPKKKEIQNREVIELFAGQISSLLARLKAEEAVSIANKNMTTVLENSLFGVAIIDKKRTIRWVNPVVCKLAGVESPEVLIGSQCGDYLCPAEQHQCPILDNGQKLDNSERILRRSDGQTIPILKSVTEIMFEGEEVLLETFIDISDRKQTEEALREREHRFNLAINGTGAGLWDWDMITDKVFFSERWKAMLGYTDDEIENAFSGWQKLWHPDDVDKIEKAVKDHLDGKTEKYEIEHRMRHKDGNWRNILTRGDLIKDENGKPVRWVGTNIDLTHIKKMEEELKLSEAKHRELVREQDVLLNNIQTQVWYLTDDQTYGAVNKAHAAFNGVDVADFAFKNMYEIFPPEIVEVCREANIKVFETGNPEYTEEWLPHASGEQRLISIAKIPKLRTDGTVEYVVCSAEDTTARKQAEVALAERLAFEKMVSRISSNFVNLPPEQIDEGINYALQSVGELFEVDRSYLNRFSEDEKTYSITHIWCRDGVEGYFEKDQNVPVELTPWWIGELKSGRLVNIENVAEMGDDAALDRADFLSEEIKSIFALALTLEGRVIGCFGFDTVFEHRVWNKKQANLLQVVAELITGAIARHDADRQIRQLSFYDQLTGIYNRRYLEHELERLDRSREHPIAVISADLDGLKLINDTLGHNEGDRYLQAGAEVLKSALRTSDILARVGGDEFALLLPRTDKVAAEMLVNRVRRNIDAYNIKQQWLPLSISLGLAVSESADYRLEETYRMADNNMYTDKLLQGKKARAEIVSSLLASLFERGNLAEGERDQVQELSIRLGQALKLPEDHLARLALFTQVYDLGKVGLPDSIIHNSMQNNKGSLTDAEREALHRHPESGYRIASSSPDLTDVAELILKHHENYDGSGYPLGLKEDAIPVECRILSIAVAYSAMTNPRPYAKTLSHEEALAELKSCAGSQFDPDLVATFINIVM